MKRRTLIQAGLALPLGYTLAGCSREKDMSQMTAGYEEGIYLSGNFGPVAEEQTLTQLEVIGQVPADLNGRFLRNGPNPLGEVDVQSHHWFIGDGMVHGVRLQEGRADWYRNRWVRSESIASKLGEATRGLPESSPNTHVIGHGGRIWALVESGTPPVELSYELETLGHSPDWGAYTAHPKLDPDTGELHAISYDWASYHNHVKYTVMGTDARMKKSVDIHMDGMPMIHDISLTKNYVVIYSLPVTVSFLALGMGDDFPFRWDDDHEPRIGLMPRDGGTDDVIWCPLQPCYAYHPMNAYEDAEGRVVVDICRYDKMFAQDTNGPFGDSLPRLDRWTIHLGDQRVSTDTIDGRPQEFPRIHPDLNSKPYRYGYTVETSGPGFPAMLKQDMQTGKSDRLAFGAGRHGAEPVFVPRQGATAEDDGYILTFVYDEASNASELLIVDARDLARGPLARVKVPRVPYGFHGSWVADA